jgi:hypothetical protein
MRVSRAFGQYPQTKSEMEIERMMIARSNRIFLFMVCTATFMSPLQIAT